MGPVSYAEALGLELHPSGSDRFRVVCPAHDDHRPSLEVSDRFGLKCWSCGVWGWKQLGLAVLGGGRLVEPGLDVAQRQGGLSGRGRIVAVYPYRDEQGEITRPPMEGGSEDDEELPL